MPDRPTGAQPAAQRAGAALRAFWWSSSKIALRSSKAKLLLSTMVMFAFFALAMPLGARALEAIAVKPESARIEITGKADYYRARGDQLQVDTVPDSDGLSARIVITCSWSPRAR